jgi:hypothetical protein
MQMYVNYHDRYVREEHEAPTVGIVLCLEKNDAVVRITLPEDNERILASTYKLHLPTEEQLRTKLLLEKESLENTPRPETEG